MVEDTGLARALLRRCVIKNSNENTTQYTTGKHLYIGTDNLPTSISGQIMILPKLAMFGQGRALEFAYSHPGEDRHDRLWK